jgi:hypothetical protein
MRLFHSATALALTVCLMTSCGSSTPSGTQLSSASDCAQWNSASLTAQRTYVQRLLGQSVEASSRGGQFGSPQWFLNKSLSEDCKTAAHSGEATTKLTAIATPRAISQLAHGEAVSTPTTATTPPPTTTSADKSASNPKSRPAFSFRGHTEHGDQIRVEGRWGPILPPSESDVDRTALQSCPDANDGRELVRRLDLTATITSSLAGEVRLGGFVVQVSPEDTASSHYILDYVMNTSEGTSCYRDTGEEGGTGVADLGTLQPHVPHDLTMWVVLPDAITPRDPQPSAKQLASEGWYIGTPAVSVDGALALPGGGAMSVTE